jgi:hypothetical protein
MEKRVYDCEVCQKPFATRQSRWMHMHRFHSALLTYDEGTIAERIGVVEQNIRALTLELSALRAKETVVVNNRFGSGHVNSMTNCNNNTNCNQIGFNTTLPVTSDDDYTDSIVPLSIENMHPYGEDYDEFISASQFKECGYSIVKILQLSHFNPHHPEHMNFIFVSKSHDDAYILGRDRVWTKASFKAILMDLLRKIVKRIACFNVAVANKYPDDTHLLMGELDSVTMNAIKGVTDYSPLAVQILTKRGIELPIDLTKSQDSNYCIPIG